MNYTNIEWTRGADGRKGLTWNPIKGLCPVGCWYCYARRMYKRFRLDEGLEFHVTRGDVAKMMRLPPSRIFVCSTMEIFHPNVREEWRDEIFWIIEHFPKHTFIILTKMPERIDRPMPPNVWLGVSVPGEHSSEYDRVPALLKADAQVKFVSFEPFLRSFDLDELFDDMTPDWIIVGRLTGHGKQRDPLRKSIEDIVDYAGGEGVPVFLKNNLASIWGKSLIQEWPR